MQAVLVMFRNDGERRSFSLSREMTVIGRRQDCDLMIPLNEISRKHCRFIRESDSVRLEDLGSSNGTFCNGRRIQEVVLSPGDTVQVGPVTFVVQIDGHPTDDEIQPFGNAAAGHDEDEFVAEEPPAPKRGGKAGAVARGIAGAAAIGAGAAAIRAGAHDDELEEMPAGEDDLQPLDDDSATIDKMPSEAELMGHLGDDEPIGLDEPMSLDDSSNPAEPGVPVTAKPAPVEDELDVLEDEETPAPAESHPLDDAPLDDAPLPLDDEPLSLNDSSMPAEDSAEEMKENHPETQSLSDEPLALEEPTASETEPLPLDEPIALEEPAAAEKPLALSEPEPAAEAEPAAESSEPASGEAEIPTLEADHAAATDDHPLDFAETEDLLELAADPEEPGAGMTSEDDLLDLLGDAPAPTNENGEPHDPSHHSPADHSNRI